MDELTRRMAGALPGTTDVVILCGGRGTRLGALSASRPKPLLPVGGRPFLLHILQRLKAEGFARVILAAHYLAEQFEAFVRAHRDLGVELELLVEPEPLGTGGALRHAASAVRSPVFVALNGDSWGFGPVAPLLREHGRGERRLTMVVVRAGRMEGGARNKGVVSLGTRGEILGFETSDAAPEQWVNAGCYVLDRAMVQAWPEGSYDLEQRFLSLVPPGAGSAWRSEGSLLDIGTPDCYAEAERAGRVGG